ncbi:MAG: DUF3192 domain-containing protein [Wenzhouxiangella sp.]|jgi:hypothetical protein|nr:DUF3192 domain-containing protein [Wenzhouxiangella sp.]
MLKTLLAAIGLFSIVTLTGCVVAVGDVKSDREANWADIERENRLAISRLEPGISMQDVQTQLGTPEFSELIESGNGDYRVLFYRTQRREADGMTSRDETTPLIFRDGRLVEWGEAAWTNLTGSPLQ